MRARLDATDWRILKELQANGRITNVELARKVGISPPPCLRRVRALEQAGMIAGYFGLLDEKSVGFEVIAFAMVGLHSQAEADLRAFENRVLAWPLVRECYMLSGETDFLLKCVAPDLTAFQDFVIDELTAAPNVASVKTTLVIRRVKFEPGVPVALAQRRRGRISRTPHLRAFEHLSFSGNNATPGALSLGPAGRQARDGRAPHSDGGVVAAFEALCRCPHRRLGPSRRSRPGNLYACLVAGRAMATRHAARQLDVSHRSKPVARPRARQEGARRAGGRRGGGSRSRAPTAAMWSRAV